MRRYTLEANRNTRDSYTNCSRHTSKRDLLVTASPSPWKIKLAFCLALASAYNSFFILPIPPIFSLFFLPRRFLPSMLSSFLLSFLSFFSPSFLLSFRPSLLLSFLHSLLPSYISFSLLSSLPFYFPSFLLSLLPSFLTDFKLIL